MVCLKIGSRNIIKNIRRFLIAMFAIVIGMTSSLLVHAFFNWNMIALRESTIRNGLGHYQLSRAGFSGAGDDLSYRYLIEDAEPILGELRQIPEVELATARMGFSGLLAAGRRSTVVFGEAGDPDREMRLRSYAGLISGKPLRSDRADGIIIGDGVAKKLSARVGDTLTLVGYMSGGGINAVDLELAGITHSGVAELDLTRAAAPLEVVQSLLSIGDSVQKIVVLLKRTADTPKVLPSIEAIAKRYGLEYKHWEDLAEFYRSVKRMYEVVFTVIILIVMLIVMFTISNTINMSLMERFREIGTIRALGTDCNQVAAIFIVESLLMGIAGGGFGLAASAAIAGLTELAGGIPVAIGGAEPGHVHIFFRLDPGVAFLCLLLFSLVAMASSVVPSRRAARISITEALRWV